MTSVPFIGTVNDPTFDSVLIRKKLYANIAVIDTLIVTFFNNPLLTAKGSILTSDGTNNVALTVGANGTHLEADSSTASGLVWRATEAFSVMKSGTQSIPSAVATQITGWTATAAGGLASANFNATTGVYTCARAGYYFFSGNVTYVNNATGYRIAELQVNGTTVAQNLIGAYTGVNGTDCVVTVGVQLAIGDAVILNAEQDSGGGLNVTGSARFSGAKFV